ncbi:MAG: hypothetical protein ACKVRN_00285 [Pyrinomonadaceae bacterium]
MKNLEEHIIRLMHDDRATDAPTYALQYAKNLYRTRVVEPKPSIIKRVLAVMQVDLAPNRAAFGERSADGSQARQMLFNAGDNAVDLRITAVKSGFDIRGQVLGDGFEDAEIEFADRKISVKVNSDETSGFKVPGLPGGKYNLTLRGKNTEIVIEGIEFK